MINCLLGDSFLDLWRNQCLVSGLAAYLHGLHTTQNKQLVHADVGIHGHPIGLGVMQVVTIIPP